MRTYLYETENEAGADILFVAESDEHASRYAARLSVEVPGRIVGFWEGV